METLIIVGGFAIGLIIGVFLGVIIYAVAVGDLID